ncbi:MAG: DUF502 domain-containing protein [Deltaproteobacteria bacterium]|nr:DUF502 domain-containing protein [Deltaproteobacteria bacterium]
MAQTGKAHFFRNTFLAGLVILIPLYVTYLLVSFLLGLLSGVGEPVLEGLFHLVGFERLSWAEPLAPAVNLSIALVAIFVLGLIGANIVGRKILATLNNLLMRLPLVRTIYGAVKQTAEAFQGTGPSFQKVVLVQFPSKGCWMMGMVASERPNTMNLWASNRVLSVFIPTTPNPTSGFLALVSPDDVLELNYDVEDAVKFIVSSGIVGKDLSPATHGAH